MADMKVDHIADVFKQRIEGGMYGTAGRLPSLTMLAQEFDTTRETMNKVIQLLQSEGLVVSKGRAGVFVSKPRARVPGFSARFDLFLKEQGLTPVETNIDPPALVSAPADVAEVFNIPMGDKVVRRVRLQGTNDEPYRVTENFYPVSLAGGPVLQKMQSDVTTDVLLEIKSRHGQAVQFVHEDVIARLPSIHEQELLKINRSSPVLEVHRKNFAEDHETVIMFNRIVLVAKFFLLSYEYQTQCGLRSSCL